jgi:hypothetical protein
MLKRHRVILKRRMQIRHRGMSRIPRVGEEADVCEFEHSDHFDPLPEGTEFTFFLQGGVSKNECEKTKGRYYEKQETIRLSEGHQSRPFTVS